MHINTDVRMPQGYWGTHRVSKYTVTRLAIQHTHTQINAHHPYQSGARVRARGVRDARSVCFFWGGKHVHGGHARMGAHAPANRQRRVCCTYYVRLHVENRRMARYTYTCTHTNAHCSHIPIWGSLPLPPPPPEFAAAA